MTCNDIIHRISSSLRRLGPCGCNPGSTIPKITSTSSNWLDILWPATCSSWSSTLFLNQNVKMPITLPLSILFPHRSHCWFGTHELVTCYVQFVLQKKRQPLPSIVIRRHISSMKAKSSLLAEDAGALWNPLERSGWAPPFAITKGFLAGLNSWSHMILSIFRAYCSDSRYIYIHTYISTYIYIYMHTNQINRLEPVTHITITITYSHIQ